MNKQLWPVLGGVLALVLVVGMLLMMKAPPAPRVASHPRARQGRGAEVKGPTATPTPAAVSAEATKPAAVAEVPKVTPAPTGPGRTTPRDAATSSTQPMPGGGGAGNRASQAGNALPPGAVPRVEGTPAGTGGYKPPRAPEPNTTTVAAHATSSGSTDVSGSGPSTSGGSNGGGGGVVSTPTPGGPQPTPGAPTMTPWYTPEPTEGPTPLPTEEPTATPEPTPTPTASPTPSMTPSAPGYMFAARQGPTTVDSAQLYVSYARLQQATDQVGLAVLFLTYDTAQLRFTGAVFTAAGAVPPMDAVEGPAGRVNISLAGNGQVAIAPGDLVRVEFTRRTPLLNTSINMGVNEGGGGVRNINLEQDLSPASRTGGFQWSGVPTPTPTPGPATPTPVETETATPSPTPSVVPSSTPSGS